MKKVERRMIALMLLIVSFFVATPLLYAQSDAFDVLDYYCTTLVDKDAGVYEHEGVLFFKVIVNYDKTSSMGGVHAEGVSMLTMKNKIKKWMLDYSANSRNKEVEYSKGIQFIEAQLDKIRTGWRFSNVQMAFDLQELSNVADAGRYIYCVCAKKDVVIENIPADFYTPCAEQIILNAIKVEARQALSGNVRERFLTECGAFDLLGANVSGGSRDAYLLVDEKIRKHLEQSDFAKDLKQAIIEAEKPQVTVKEVEEVNEAKTLSIKRVETVTVTHNPRMQKLFLNWETEENFPLPTTSLGETTKKNLFRGKTSVVDSIQHLKTALIENPGDKELWNYLGRKLMDNGEPLLAIIAYRNALKLDPTFIYPMVNLANAYLAIKQYDLAFGLATALQGMELDSWSEKESVRILQTDCE
jgi:tetratricopeptide (TPR) repeat protein